MGDHGGMILLSEFMEGGTLEDFFHKRARASASKPSQRLAPAAVFRWMQDLSQALCFLHNCSPPIIHRDLKPANILLGTEGRLKVLAHASLHFGNQPLCQYGVPHRCIEWLQLRIGAVQVGDLGLSSVLAREHAVSAAGPGRTSYMMTGKTGTLRYMAPEVLNVNERGQSVYDDKVDIYSASMVMWFMCMGERPFGNLDSNLLVMGTIKGLRPDLSSIRRKYGGFVADIISRCWAGNPEDRYTAEELVNVIQVAREAIATGAAMPGGIPQEKKSGTKLGRRFARATSWLSSRFLSSKKEQSDRRGSFRKKAQAESASSDAPPSPQAGAANGDWPSAEFSRTQSPTEGGRSAHGWRGWDQPSRRVHSERPAAWRESYLDWDRPGVVWGSSFDQSSLSELLDLTVKSAPGGDWFGSGALGYAAMPPHRSLGTGSDSESGHSCRGSGRHSPSTSGRHSPSTSIGNSGSLPRSGSFQRQSVDSKRSTIAGPSPFTQSVENGIATALLAGAGPVAHGESSPPSTAEGQTRAGKLQATAPHLGRASLSTESADGFDASKGIFKMDAV